MELPEAALLSPRTRYIIVEPISLRDYNQMYRGIDRLTQQFVAIKMQHLPDPAASRELMIYSALSNLRHRHVCQLLQHFVVDFRLTMVFELPSSNLQVLWGSASCQKGLLSTTTIGKHIVGILSGVHHLHEQDIFHGDLSLSKMLLATDGRSMVSDTGASVSAYGMLNSSATRTTLYVSSPESWLKGVVSKSADVWAVGVATMCLVMGAFSPILPEETSIDNLLYAMVKHLGGIDESIWPGVHCLPCWNTVCGFHSMHLRKPSYSDFSKSLIDLLPQVRPNLNAGLCMVRRLLVWCPEHRPTCLQALYATPFRSCVLAQALDLDCEIDFLDVDAKVAKLPDSIVGICFD